MGENNNTNMQQNNESMANAEQKEPAANAVPPVNVPQKKKNKKGIIIAGGAVLLVILILVLILVNGKKTINLEEYVTVGTDGYDGQGTAYAEWKSELEDVVLKAMGIDAEKMDEYIDNGDFLNSDSSLAKAYAAYEKYDEMMESLDLHIDKSENLSNGDKITVTITYNNELAAENGIKFTGEKYVYVVSGLEKLEAVDPFEGLTVEFTGASPQLKAELSYNSPQDFLQESQFSIDKIENLKIGDTVTVTCNCSKEDAAYHGVSLSETTKEYTVGEADAYVGTVRQLEEKGTDDMQKDAKDVIESYFARNTDQIGYKNLKYQGIYVLNQKQSNGWDSYNSIYMIYSATVTSKEDEKQFQATKVYLPVQFTNVILSQEGELTWDVPNEIAGTTGLRYGWFGQVSGYETEKDMYQELIAQQKDKYTYEISKTLQEF